MVNSFGLGRSCSASSQSETNTDAATTTIDFSRDAALEIELSPALESDSSSLKASLITELEHGLSANIESTSMGLVATQQSYLQVSEQDRGLAWLPFLVDFILGPNTSNQVWRFRLLNTFCLVVAVTASAHLLPEELHGAHTTYEMLIAIAKFGVPIVVPAISLVVSFWIGSNPDGQANWLSGLSVINASISFGGLLLYLTLLRGN